MHTIVICWLVAGHLLHLNGLGAFDAATHCASISAGERKDRGDAGDSTGQSSSSTTSSSQVIRMQEDSSATDGMHSSDAHQHRGDKGK